MSNKEQWPQPHGLSQEGRNTEYNQLLYSYPVEQLWSGGSYGNMGCFARTDRLSNLDGLWHAGTNEWLCGQINLTLQAYAKPLHAVETLFCPGHQLTVFAGRGLRAEKLVFVPYGAAVAVGSECSFYTVLRLQASEAVEVRITCDIRWPAVTTRTQTKQPERHHTQRRVRQWLEGSLLWAETAPFRVDRWNTVLGKHGEVRALQCPGGANATFSEPGRARLLYTLSLAAGEEVTLPFLLAASTDGIDDLRERLRLMPGWSEALDATVASYEEVLHRAWLRTPDLLINRGLQWAKANTVRVQHRYKQGAAFTNDPPQDIVVVRDCAWYALGSDWLTPGFSEAMYNLIMEHGLHEGGKLTEYIHADTGEREDYALNINDDTPLFVISATHYYAVSGSDTFLQRVYPVVQQACDWMLAQRRDGLVWCSAEGTDVWGNATWRNIIPGYKLAGAVTEINALCYAALRAAVNMAQAANMASDAARWSTAAQELQAATNIRLASEDGLYVLNLDEDGPNNTRTADLVFPVLSEVADEGQAHRILDLLYSQAFYTPYGIHTVCRSEAEYHASFGFGLMGGLWPNLTAWVAYAGRKLYPERLAEMMNAIYSLCEKENPLSGGHLVPGEFPEWFHAETYESLGMAMSPWMPPTYLWLGVEGLAGVTPRVEGLSVSPNLPAHWRWLVMRNLPYRGQSVSFFVHNGHLHTTCRVESALPQSVYSRDVTPEVEAEGELCIVAFEDEAGISLLACASGAAQGTAATENIIRFREHTLSVSLAPGEAILVRWNTTGAP